MNVTFSEFINRPLPESRRVGFLTWAMGRHAHTQPHRRQLNFHHVVILHTTCFNCPRAKKGNPRQFTPIQRRFHWHVVKFLPYGILSWGNTSRKKIFFRILQKRPASLFLSNEDILEQLPPPKSKWSLRSKFDFHHGERQLGIMCFVVHTLSNFSCCDAHRKKI